jgi:hypothetical protein
VESKKEYDGPRVYLSRAYLKLLESNTYGLFRDVLSEDRTTRERERMGHVGPIKVLRPVQAGERPEIRTVDPGTGALLELVSIA